MTDLATSLALFTKVTTFSNLLGHTTSRKCRVGAVLPQSYYNSSVGAAIYQLLRGGLDLLAGGSIHAKGGVCTT